jgi:hypothetical protein
MHQARITTDAAAKETRQVLPNALPESLDAFE